MSPPPRPALLVSIVVVIEIVWSMNSIAAKFGLMHLDPLTLASFRIVFAGLVVTPVYLLTTQRMKVERRDLPTLGMLGIFVVGINQACFTIGLNYTTVGHSAIIICCGPILVLVLARALRLEAITQAKLIGMILSFAGCVLLATEYGIHMNSGTLFGDVITMMGTSGFALYTVFGKRVVAKYDTVTTNSFCHWTGAMLWLPIAVYKGTRLEWARVGWQGWAAVAFMGGLGSIGAYLVYWWALRYFSASRLAAFGYLMPVIATALGVVVLREALTGRFLTGSAMVLGGVYLAERHGATSP